MTHGSFVCLWISMGTWHIFPALSLSFSLCLKGLMTWLTLEFIFIFLGQTIAFMFFIRKFQTKNFVFYLLVCGGLWNSWSDRNLYNVKFEVFFFFLSFDTFSTDKWFFRRMLLHVFSIIKWGIKNGIKKCFVPS